MKKSNPFKFGSVVDEPYFTNRVKELKQIKHLLQSSNHLVLISPRRYGKTSLMLKAVRLLDRPYIFLDLQLITDISDFAAQLLKRIYRVYPFERLKQLIKNFRIVPTLNLNPVTNEVDVSFSRTESPLPLLEDVFNLIESLGNKSKRPIVILDEFQEIYRINSNLDRQLRAVIQHHKNVNYAFLGSLESMMREIFERKKSPFYHIGQLIPLDKIPENDFFVFLNKGFTGKCVQKEEISRSILAFTKSHPYYTQQLAYIIWENCEEKISPEQHLRNAIDNLMRIHDMDYERLWQTLKQTDKKVLIALAIEGKNILSGKTLTKYGIPAPSTGFSSLKRLSQQGFVIKTAAKHEIDDIFFAEWIRRKREE